MGLARKLSLAGPLIGAALAVCSAGSAAAAEAFRIQEVGQNGGSCGIVYSTVTNEPATRWDKKGSKPKTIAIGEDWKYCPKTIPYQGYDIEFDLLQKYKLDGLVITAYFSNGSRVSIFRQYGSVFKFNWISVPKKS